MKKIYVCYRYSNDPVSSRKIVRQICKEIADNEDCCMPIAPQIYLHHFLSESGESGYETAMKMCFALMRECNELRVYMDPSDDCFTKVSRGMRMEIEQACRDHMPVRFVRMSDDSYNNREQRND